MRIIADGDRSYTYNARYEGHIELEMLRASHDQEIADVTRLRYYDGAVTKWHSHPGGQLLYVLAGTGRVGTEFGCHDIPPDTLVEVPPGERHWHGAARGTDSIFLISTWGTTHWTDESPEEAR